MMKLLYKKIGFTLSLREKVQFTVPPTFIMRSIIGSRLRAMCCVAHNVLCGECMFHGTCVYGLVFESIVPKDNEVLAGRDRISHPVILDIDSFSEDCIDSLTINLIFLGPAIPYLPYFYGALKSGGEAGLLKERIPYTLTGVFDQDGSLLINGDTIHTQTEPDVWVYDYEYCDTIHKDIMIQLNAPLRFKADGHYTHRFNPGQFMFCLHRRLQTLCSQYGGNDAKGEYAFSHSWGISARSLVWKDYTHYSARQKKGMRLGGVTGSFVVSGDFTAYEYACLKFAEIFHAGKNTNFGLGKLTLWEKS
ncbi:MAG: CRISPR system precrRNA processing endoribonuclease RAMP protein Cas6, partial [Treponema sp.]|nr:CRISPR system precrRNA processing endoribonuclease RAMP protein Cas6 [Treponema sp.]